ncbi:MAG: FhaA domain-containing protein [Chloroflexota bacterium]|nr:FhaA domain-containing protein [Chloroflexota bacterium]
MNINLDLIEARLRNLFEDALFQVFREDSTPVHLIDALLSAIAQNMYQTENGDLLAPDRFTIQIAPDETPNQDRRQELLYQISAELAAQAEANGFRFLTPPVIQLAPAVRQENAPPRVKATFSRLPAALPDTAAMEDLQTVPVRPKIPQNAFLVIGGKTNFPLTKTVINIGRHSDNDLILEDQFVSRHHAQLRAIENSFVIFDVGSTGGIFLNNKQISRATLHPGDVLRLGTVNLIYSQDTTSEQPTSAVPVETDDQPFGDDHA